MSDAIITVEGVGKRYRIHHERPERYTALRDVITRKVKGLFRPSAISHQSLASEEDFWALKDVSFEVKQGEVVGIIGRNGAGKSTLLKILSRITEPTEGRITLKGRVASLLEVGTGFHPELTGRENIFLNGAILGMTKVEIRSKFDEIVAFAEVEKFLDTPVKRYSSGMYVRLAFAVAAHLEPEILVIDEVLAVGDAEFQKKCLGKMSEVAKGGRTVLFVSHNMAAVRTLCSRAVYLREGTVRKDGVVDDLVENYLADSHRAEASRLNEPIFVGTHLKLTRFVLEPSPVASGAGTGIVLEFYAETATKISELAVLIYSSQGVRTAILDFRSCGLPLALAPGDTRRLSCQIKSLPLVEGTYGLGLYAATNDFRGNLTDLLALNVTPSPDSDRPASYPAAHRGLLELDFVAEIGK